MKKNHIPMKDFAPIKARVIEFLDEIGEKRVDFREKTGLSLSILKNKNSELTGDSISIIAENYPQLRADWLITGIGNKIRDINNLEYDKSEIMSVPAEVIIEQYKRLYEEIKNQLFLQSKIIKSNEKYIKFLEKGKEQTKK